MVTRERNVSIEDLQDINGIKGANVCSESQVDGPVDGCCMWFTSGENEWTPVELAKN